MIYVYFGTDTKRTGDALLGAVAKLRARAPDAHVERITDEAEVLDLDSLLMSVGLFHTARIVILDGIFVHTEHKKEIMARLKELADSEHIFFIREEKLLAPELKKLETHAKALVHHEARVGGKKETFNTFSIADALLSKDKRQLWLRLTQALRAGSEPEELHGILFWGAKNLMLAFGSSSVAESGLNPFVYQKARAALPKFTKEEVQKLVADLAELPHVARREGVELEYALELFSLKR